MESGVHDSTFRGRRFDDRLERRSNALVLLLSAAFAKSQNTLRHKLCTVEDGTIAYVRIWHGKALPQSMVELLYQASLLES